MTDLIEIKDMVMYLFVPYGLWGVIEILSFDIVKLTNAIPLIYAKEKSGGSERTNLSLPFVICCSSRKVMFRKLYMWIRKQEAVDAHFCMCVSLKHFLCFSFELHSCVKQTWMPFPKCSYYNKCLCWNKPWLAKLVTDGWRRTSSRHGC